MRILALSDLHFGKTKNGWETYATERVDAAIKAATKFQPDVFYFGGDLADHGPEGDRLFHFRRGLEALARIPVQQKVFLCGNHDLEFLEGESLFDYAGILQETVGKYGFHLIDQKPYIYGDQEFAFVGNIALHDGAFWTKPEKALPPWPSTLEDVKAADVKYWTQAMSGFKDVETVSSRDFHDYCMARLLHDFNSTAGIGAARVILCTHYTPGAEFLLGGNAKFEYLNWYMAFDGIKMFPSPYYSSRTVLGLCGHTHRDHLARIGSTWVRNVSGPNQPSVIDVAS